MSVLNRRIHVVALALAGGISWGVGAAALAIWAMMGYGMNVVEFMSEVYPGYGASIPGALLGAVWGFIDLFAGLFIFALLYNLFAGKPKQA